MPLSLAGWKSRRSPRTGVMNEGEVATPVLAFPAFRARPRPSCSNAISGLGTGGRYHAGQISCRASLDIIRAAKERGLPVTCGVSINHLTLNENDIGPYRTLFKMRPPLRSEDDLGHGRGHRQRRYRRDRIRARSAGRRRQAPSLRRGSRRRHRRRDAALRRARAFITTEASIFHPASGLDRQPRAPARASERPPRQGSAGRPRPHRSRDALRW